MFGAHGSRSRWVHTVGKCANIPRARYERASSMCTGRMQVLSGGFVGGGFPCHLTPLEPPCKVLTPLAAATRDLPLCWASEVAPPVLPRGRIKLIIFQYFFRIAEDELQKFAIGEINTFRTINVRTYMCIGSSILFRKSSYLFYRDI